MAEGAKVNSLDALKHFKTYLWKFSEAANLALADAESEMQRMLLWLETEQGAYWQGQIRKRTEILSRANELLRYKQIYKSPTGSRQSTIEEEKAVQIAKRRLLEAQEKVQNVVKSSRRLTKEIQTYKGSVQRFATSAQLDVPVAAAKLDNMVATLEAYMSLGATGGSSTDAASSGGAFTRAELPEDRPVEPPPPDEIPIRGAVPEEAATLTDLALRSIQTWRYSPEETELWRPPLIVREDYIATSPVFVTERDGRIIGFYGLSGSPPHVRLAYLYVDPDKVRLGLGTALWHHAIQTASQLGYAELQLTSDPNAEAFFIKLGARRFAKTASPLEGQELPVLRFPLASDK